MCSQADPVTYPELRFFIRLHFFQRLPQGLYFKKLFFLLKRETMSTGAHDSLHQTFPIHEKRQEMPV